MWIKKVKSFLDNTEMERIRLACFQLLGPGASVSVSEISCPEPDCPPVKTVILVFREGEPTISHTIHRPMKEIGLSDLRVALAPGRDL